MARLDLSTSLRSSASSPFLFGLRTFQRLLRQFQVATTNHSLHLSSTVVTFVFVGPVFVLLSGHLALELVQKFLDVSGILLFGIDCSPPFLPLSLIVIFVVIISWDLRRRRHHYLAAPLRLRLKVLVGCDVIDPGVELVRRDVVIFRKVRGSLLIVQKVLHQFFLLLLRFFYLIQLCLFQLGSLFQLGLAVLHLLHGQPKGSSLSFASRKPRKILIPRLWIKDDLMNALGSVFGLFLATLVVVLGHGEAVE